MNEQSTSKTSKKSRFPTPEREAVTVRLDKGEYRKLRELALEQGTQASVLIRQAVKEILKKAGM